MIMTSQIRYTTSSGLTVSVLGEVSEATQPLLSDAALEFLAYLHTTMEPKRQELLVARQQVRAAIAAGARPGFESTTKKIRDDDSWRVAPLAPGLKDRRAEIAGPVDRKMTINALNSGAKCWLADFEDACTPTWENMIEGQRNLYEAIRGQIRHTDQTTGRTYKLKKPALAQSPTILPRPRGLHLDESHIVVEDQPIAGALMAFGLFFFHNAHELVHLGRGPYFYLPKLEHHLEARWWNDVFTKSQDYLNIPHGTIRATVLIETITAAFQMDEILYQLRDHSAGLNAGRWDYIFSIIKNFQDSSDEFVLPDRSDVTMQQPMMRAYTELLVRTCHRRGAHAIGGMAAYVPDKSDPVKHRIALEKVREEKSREAADGFDGSWVAHPDLVPVCMRVYDELLFETPHQIRTRKREDVVPDAEALLNVKATTGAITEAGIRTNIEAGIHYLDAWLRGHGGASINDLMEDAATAEISRSQLWQWIRTEATATTAQGSERTVTREWVDELINEIVSAADRSDQDRITEAQEVFSAVVFAEEFPEFLTIPAYNAYLAADANTRVAV
ncbi:malate synthase A [Auritidibacter sp. NML100628]|nr:malate synthase A [Auritidibacter sp. NML100628]PXA75518.1 malate synthase A [Auritidibacter sp. NML100628]